MSELWIISIHNILVNSFIMANLQQIDDIANKNADFMHPCR